MCRGLQLLLTLWARHVTIDTLPDDVLLHIFHFVRLGVTDLDPTSFPHGLTYYHGWDDDIQSRQSWWHPLIHVCRNWRSVVLASPNFLDLRLVCVPSTRMELVGIWPPLPIIIRNNGLSLMPEDYDFDIATVHRNRICEISLYLTSSQLQRLASAMQEQYPALIHLELMSGQAPTLPDGFLGASAPRLQYLRLQSITFPALPKLLWSATDLVRLTLEKIPHTGYISAEVIVAALAVLANLESLTVEFESPLSRPSRRGRRSKPPTRPVLPALTSFRFQGVSEYLEDLVARIDAPLLDFIQITLFHQLIFDIPQLGQFMRRATRLKAPNQARVDFDQYGVLIIFPPQTGVFDKTFALRISCRVLEWQLSSLAQLLTSLLPSFYTVEQVYVYTIVDLSSQWQNDIENVQWLEIFHPLTTVKNLYVCKEFVQCIAFALQDLVRERVTDVLPALESLFLDGLQLSGPVQEAIRQFIAARQLSGHPLTLYQHGGYITQSFGPNDTEDYLYHLLKTDQSDLNQSCQILPKSDGLGVVFVVRTIPPNISPTPFMQDRNGQPLWLFDYSVVGAGTVQQNGSLGFSLDDAINGRNYTLRDAGLQVQLGGGAVTKIRIRVCGWHRVVV